MKQTIFFFLLVVCVFTNAKAQTVLFNVPRVFVQSKSSPCCYAKDYHESLAVTDTIQIDTSCCGYKNLKFTRNIDSVTGMLVETGLSPELALAI